MSILVKSMTRRHGSSRISYCTHTGGNTPHVGENDEWNDESQRAPTKHFLHRVAQLASFLWLVNRAAGLALYDYEIEYIGKEMFVSSLLPQERDENRCYTTRLIQYKNCISRKLEIFSRSL